MLDLRPWALEVGGPEPWTLDLARGENHWSSVPLMSLALAAFNFGDADVCSSGSSSVTSHCCNQREDMAWLADRRVARGGGLGLGRRRLHTN